MAALNARSRYRCMQFRTRNLERSFHFTLDDDEIAVIPNKIIRQRYSKRNEGATLLAKSPRRIISRITCATQLSLNLISGQR